MGDSFLRILHTQTPHATAGAWERMAIDEGLGQPQEHAQVSDFVFVEILQGFYDFSLFDHGLYHFYTIVVRFDQMRMLGSFGLNGIRVDGSLPEQKDIGIEVHFLEGLLLHLNECLPDHFSFFFREVDLFQGMDKGIARIIGFEIGKSALSEQ